LHYDGGVGIGSVMPAHRPKETKTSPLPPTSDITIIKPLAIQYCIVYTRRRTAHRPPRSVHNIITMVDGRIESRVTHAENRFCRTCGVKYVY